MASHATANISAPMPVRTNLSGNQTEGAAALVAGLAARAAGLMSADIGKIASIRLLLGFGSEASLLQFSVNQRRPPARVEAQGDAIGQRGRGFQRFHQRLRRFESARIQLNN